MGTWDKGKSGHFASCHILLVIPPLRTCHKKKEIRLVPVHLVQITEYTDEQTMVPTTIYLQRKTL